MKITRRIYDEILKEHLVKYRQMAFICGPRQVGKTTTCGEEASFTLNWDFLDDRQRILKGPKSLADELALSALSAKTRTLLFDELHKYPAWKQFLKGFFDVYADDVKIMVTGSSRLDTYRRVGDSLMGRYFLYRMHPFSTGEIARTSLPTPEKLVQNPVRIPEEDFQALWTFGGFPDPYLQRDPQFSRRWQALRRQQLIREDLRDLTQIQHVDQFEVLARILDERSGEQLIYSNLSAEIRVSIETVRQWIATLENLHHGFLIRPWFQNVSRSLRKEPKWYLRDWAGISDKVKRAETFVGCHLLKTVDAWNDLGLGAFHLGYLRDKNKREVDFVVCREGEPWFLVEVKVSDTRVSESLRYFQEQINVPFAFQVVLELDYVEADCFQERGRPRVVPARTFLSQLL